MLNVGNINKNVEMLKNVDIKIKFWDTNNIFLRSLKQLLIILSFTNIYSQLYNHNYHFSY